MSVAQSTDVRMPRLSDSMEEGTIVRWLKQAGDSVAVGEAIVEIETDKATMEYEAEAAGTLEILAAEGATVALGEAIARLLAEGGTRTEARPARVRATPVARRIRAGHRPRRRHGDGTPGPDHEGRRRGVQGR